MQILPYRLSVTPYYPEEEVQILQQAGCECALCDLLPCVICCCVIPSLRLGHFQLSAVPWKHHATLISAFCTCSFLCLGWHSFLVLMGISSLLVKFISTVTSSGQASLVSDILAAAVAKSLRSCPTLCDPIDRSLWGSPIPGILQARTLEWVAISFSSAWKWKVKVKLLSPVRLFATPRTAAYQAPLSMGFSRQEYWSGVPLPSPSDILRLC